MKSHPNSEAKLPLAALIAAVLLLPLSAEAAGNWTINYKSGQAVMGEISQVTWTVTNLATSTVALNEVSLRVNGSNYDINNGTAPPGWVVALVDRNNRVIKFAASGTCPPSGAGTFGLAAGQSADFSITLVGAAANSDVNTETFVTNGGKTFARESCSATTFTAFGGTPTWRRIGVGGSISVSPRTTSLLGQVTFDLVVTNRSSAGATQTLTPTATIITNVTNPASPYEDSTAFDQPSGPTPGSMGLGQDQTGTFNFGYRARKQGVFTFTTSARNANISSPSFTTLTVAVGQFPGSVAIWPEAAVDGQTVTVSLIVSNNDSEGRLYTNVTPNPLLFSGTAGATATQIGPSPASLPSLAPGNAASFQWTYQVNGTAGATYAFTGRATAIRDGSSIATDPAGSAVGRIAYHVLQIKPNLLSASGARDLQYTVINGGSLPITQIQLLKPDTTYFTLSGTPFALDTNTGWVQVTRGDNLGPIYSVGTGTPIAANGGSKTFTISYSAIGSVPITTAFSHRMVLTQNDATTVRVDAPVTVFTSRVVALLGGVTALAKSGQVTLGWSNPSDHDGVLIVKSTAGVVSATPTPGYRYEVGEPLGNGTVLYSDTSSYVSSYTDTAVTNGQPYYYKIYNHDSVYRYSTTDIPSVDGLFARPVSGTPPWAYTVGYQSTQQPFVGYSAVFSSSNAATFTANATAAGSEIWRPVALTAAIGARPTVATVQGLSGPHIFVGDYNGNVAAITASTGLLNPRWGGVPRGTPNGTGFGNGGGAIGTSVTSQAGVQLTQYEDPATTWGAAYRARYPGEDLIYFTTFNALAGSNQVWALSSVDGFQKFVYSPGDLDVMSGGVMVDYTHNRIWIPSRAGGGTASLRVLDILNPGLGAIRSFYLGDIDNPVVRLGNEAFVVNNAGVVYGYNLDTFDQVFTIDLGKRVSNYLVATSTGFIASTATGVQRYRVDTSVTPHPVTAQWPTPTAPVETAITGATAGRVDFAEGKVYVGDSLGNIHKLSLSTGAKEATINLSSQTMGMPALDTTSTPHRVFVGSREGRIFAVDVPFF